MILKARALSWIMVARDFIAFLEIRKCLCRSRKEEKCINLFMKGLIVGELIGGEFANFLLC